MKQITDEMKEKIDAVMGKYLAEDPIYKVDVRGRIYAVPDAPGVTGDEIDLLFTIVQDGSGVVLIGAPEEKLKDFCKAYCIGRYWRHYIELARQGVIEIIKGG